MKIGDFIFEKLHGFFQRVPFIRLKDNLLNKVEFDESLLSGKLKLKISPYLDDLYYDERSNELDHQGIVVFKAGSLFDKNNAMKLLDEINHIVTENNKKTLNSSEFNYYALRDMQGVSVVFRDTKEDYGMLDIFNIHRGLSNSSTQQLDNLIKELQKKVLQNSKLKYSFKGWSAYVSNGVTNTRGPHIDNFKGSLKAFLYLTDCQELESGPYVFIPNTCSLFGKALLLAQSYVSGRFQSYTDVALNALENEKIIARSIYGAAGTVFVSNQSGVHFGYPQGNNGNRMVLVANFDRA